MRNKILGMLLILGLLVPGLAFAQGTTVNGALTDADGEALIGANVIIKELNIGSSTDIEGNYSFEVPASNVGSTVTLVTAYVGYSSQERTITLVAGTMTEDFVLSFDVLNLDEVVVTGVAIATPKKKLAFTVASVSDELLSSAPAGDPVSSLAGKIAGATVVSASNEPGAGVSIRLRASSSLESSAAPLYIVDGVILGANQVDVGTLDIASIEVVKGAAAASLYGSRAQNGVVQITTKRGKDTPINQTRIVLRNEYGVSVIASDFEANQSHGYLMNADQSKFIAVDGVTEVDFGELDANGNAYVLAQDIENGPDSYSVAGNQIGFFDNPFPGKTYNAFDEFFQNGVTATNSVSLSQNTEKTNFKATLGRYRETGVVALVDGLTRNSFRVNLDHRMNDKFNFSTSAYYAATQAEDATNTQVNPFFGVMFTTPAVSLTARDEDGNLNFQADPYSVEENPLYVVENANTDNQRSRFITNVSAGFTPTNWFDLNVVASYDRFDGDYSEFYDKGFQQVGSTSLIGGHIYRSNTFSRAVNADITGALHRSFGDMSVRAQARYAIEDFSFTNNTVTGTNLKAKGNSDLANVKGILDGGTRTLTTNRNIVRSQAFYGILDLDYNDRYIVSLLGRRDGSSLFGPDQRWQTYYRVSAAYRVSEESFWDGMRDVLGETKLRFSLGTAGNRPPYEAQYGYFSLSDGKTTKSTIGNPGLKPELSTEMEFGLELAIMDRVSVEAVYAQTVVEDLVLLIPQSAATGFSAGRFENAGGLESNTIELTVNANAIQTRDMSLDFMFVFDKTNQNITDFIPPAYPTGPLSLFYYRADEKVGAMYGDLWMTSTDQLPEELAPFASSFQVNDEGFLVPVGLNNSWKDGISKKLWGSDVPLDADSTAFAAFGLPMKYTDEENGNLQLIGNTIPDFNVGFNTSFSFKSFTANMLWGAQIGGDVYNRTAQWSYRENQNSAQNQAGVSEANKKPFLYYKSLYNIAARNSAFVEDGTFLKLRELSLDYTFGREMLSSVFGDIFHKVKIGVSGRNLLTITDYTGFDPEVGDTSGGGNADATLYRVDNFNYPAFRTFSGRITLEF